MSKQYLKTIPREEARKLFLEPFIPADRLETIPVTEADGRVTGRTVLARRSIPAYPCAAMDGIAVPSALTFSAQDQHPLRLTEGEHYLPIDTGDPLPDGYDAVIPWEELQPLTEGGYEIRRPAHPYQHVRPVGEDVVGGEVILPLYHRITPPDLGALLAGGVCTVEVLAKPRVAIIPTGDELVSPEASIQRGEIPEYNSPVLAAYARRWGGEPQIFPVVKDDPEVLEKTIEAALESADILLVNAGSSSGRGDFTATVLGKLGKVLVHGLSTRPGKPTILAYVRGKPCMGVPGYPVSAYLSLQWFLYPLLCLWFHQREETPPRLEARLGRRIVSELGSEEFVRVAIGRMEDSYIAHPLPRGAGVTMSLVKADGILTIPAHSQGFEEGERVEIELHRSREEIEHTILAVGSHDLALDLLASVLRKKGKGFRLLGFHVGSMGGLLSIRKGETHLAGIHLFDERTASYNVPYIEKYLQGIPIVLLNLVYRTQGLMVEPGNPHGIRGIEDLVARKVPFVNRQKGSGTRILLDYLLKQKGIEPRLLPGYEREEYTHLGVAAAIASGTAGAGMGIYSAARLYGLEFIPLCEERYDLLVREEFFRSEEGQALVESISDPDFKEEVERMGGYSTRDSGTVLYRSGRSDSQTR